MISKEAYEQAIIRWAAASTAVGNARKALYDAETEMRAAEDELCAQESRPGIAAYLNAGAK